MSQYLVAFYNNTDIAINFLNTEDSGNDRLVSVGELIVPPGPFNIPDDSDPSVYFADHHMELRDIQGNSLFSFWDNDHKDYNLLYCYGTDWADFNTMPGFYNGGNKTRVGIVVSGSGGNYNIQACEAID